MGGILSLLSKDDPQPMHELIKWYHARSMFLGLDGKWRSRSRGLWLAARCKHIIDATWLVNVFPGGVPPTSRQVKQRFQQWNADPRGMCFEALLGYQLGDPGYDTLMESAAQKGNALAQVRV